MYLHLSKYLLMINSDNITTLQTFTRFLKMCFFLFLLVSPEAIGFLSAVGVFIILMLLLFLYINKKMCFENVSGFPDLDSGYTTRKNSQDKLCKYLTYGVLNLIIRMHIFTRM